MMTMAIADVASISKILLSVSLRLIVCCCLNVIGSQTDYRPAMSQ